MTPRGFETPPQNTDHTAFSGEGAAKSGAVHHCQELPADPDLARLVEAWPELPQPIRAAIVAMVDAAG